MKRRVMLMVGAMALAVAVFGGVAQAAFVDCSTDPCKGTPEDDRIRGTADGDTILALAGDDQVDGFFGNDKVFGGDGDDFLRPAEDSDEAHGNRGADTINLAEFDAPRSEPSATMDFGFGGRGNDTIIADDGNKDVIDCGRGRRDEVAFDKEIDTVKNCEIKNPVSAVPAAAATAADTDPARRTTAP